MDGTSVGTPNYISPEQARGEEKIDIRSDIYSLGASLYHMAVGGPPFSGANPMVVMTKHVTDFPEPPKKRCPALSEGFSSLVMKMMQKRREDRPQDPEAVIQDLERLLNGEPLRSSAAPDRHPTSVPRPSTHHGHTGRAHSSGSSAILPAAKSSAAGGLLWPRCSASRPSSARDHAFSGRGEAAPDADPQDDDESHARSVSPPWIPRTRRRRTSNGSASSSIPARQRLEA
jgi:serine/threonine protein kinase